MEQNAQCNHKLDNGKNMDDVTFAFIDILARKDHSWDVTAMEIPHVPFYTSLFMVKGGLHSVNAAECIGHGGGRLVASTYSPHDVSCSLMAHKVYTVYPTGLVYPTIFGPNDTSSIPDWLGILS
jgi:hypothetical protein